MSKRLINTNPEVAVDTLKLLLTSPIGDFDDSELTVLVEAEQNFLKSIRLPDPGAKMTEKTCAEFETALSDFLPTIPVLRSKLTVVEFEKQIALAKQVATVIDETLGATSNYWTDLVGFLADAEQDSWNRWRKAFFAEAKAREAIRQGEYRHAKMNSIYGLKTLGDIPDRRQYLRLCSRLQCSLAEGEGVMSMAAPLGEWIFEEAENLCFYLLAASMAYNLGNQHIIAGNAGTDTFWLDKAQEISKRWKYIRDMNFYRVAVLERLALIMQRQKKYPEMKSLLEEYIQTSGDARGEILYNQGMAAYHEYNDDLMKAEEFIQKARNLAMQKMANGKYVDPYNAWASLITLACIYTRSENHTAAEAIEAFEKAKIFGESLDGFMNDNRWCSYHIFSARAQADNDDLDKLRSHLDQADALLQRIDAPRHAVRRAILEAHYCTKNNNKQESLRWIDDARQLCSKHNIIDYEKEIDS